MAILGTYWAHHLEQTNNSPEAIRILLTDMFFGRPHKVEPGRMSTDSRHPERDAEITSTDPWPFLKQIAQELIEKRKPLPSTDSAPQPDLDLSVLLTKVECIAYRVEIAELCREIAPGEGVKNSALFQSSSQRVSEFMYEMGEKGLAPDMEHALAILNNLARNPAVRQYDFLEEAVKSACFRFEGSLGRRADIPADRKLALRRELPYHLELDIRLRSMKHEIRMESPWEGLYHYSFAVKYVNELGIPMPQPLEEAHERLQEIALKYRVKDDV